MRKFTLFILAFFLVVGTYGVASAGIHDGERLFKRYCVKCHGADGSVSKHGKGLNPPARDLRTNRLFLAPAQLRSIIKYGLYGREMKAWQGILSDKNIIDVAAFVRTLTYEPSVEAGKKFYKARCAACHASTGAVKQLFVAPDLDMSPLGRTAMARVAREGRHGTMMKPKRDMYKNADLADAIEYLQSIKK